MEFGFGEGGYQPSEFIKRYLPQGTFDLLIADEAHEYKNGGSAQGQAMGVLAAKGSLYVTRGFEALRFGLPDGAHEPAHASVIDALWLPIPRALRPTPLSEFGSNPPGPGVGQQNSIGNERHQLWPSNPKVGYPDPILYKIEVKMGTHSFTSSKVLPINALGQPAESFDGDGTRGLAPCAVI